MNATRALAALKSLGVPAVTTADAAAVLGASVTAASQTLRRLAANGLITPVRRGLWAVGESRDPLLYAGYVTAPYPGYVSLQTALHLHGLIEQIPAMTYVVSLGRDRLLRTRLGAYSVHHVQPAMFGGFELRDGVPLATPEKSLVDFLYLSRTRTRLFARLPEIELPRQFRRGVAREWARRISSDRLRASVRRQLELLL